MNMRNISVHPTQTAIASAATDNNLTITINAVAGESVYVYGLDASFALVNSYQVEITDGSSIAWTGRFNQVVNRDFSNAPMQLTRGNSAQMVVTYTASLANNVGRAVLRYLQKP